MSNPFPRITIITPTLNQGRYIQETIESVLRQDYPNLEYIIMDGGSTDETPKIVEQYRDRLIWISEPDHGQAEAINKGIRMATGEIIAFLNSDDYYFPGTLLQVGRIFNENPNVYWLTGNYQIINEKGDYIHPFTIKYKNLYRAFSSPHVLRMTNYLIQPSTFWRKLVHNDIGGFDELLRYVFDYDFWLRMMDRYPPYLVDSPLSYFRIHNQSKGGKEYHHQFSEEMDVLIKYRHSAFEYHFHKFHNWLIVKAYEAIK
jgi:glycosyltransferase involved in cell wall biosynthesis